MVGMPFSVKNKIPSNHDNRRLFMATTTTVTQKCDVLVLGSGPAARAIASLLSSSSASSDMKSQNDPQLQVILCDRNLDRVWVPNYGVWHDEWQAIVDRYLEDGVVLQGGRTGDAIDRRWNVTDCYFGGSFGIPAPERLRVNRPYYRVDKDALRQSLMTKASSSSSSKNEDDSAPYQQIRANHFSRCLAPNLYTPKGSVIHDEQGTTMTLMDENENPITISSKIVIDCTGHETKLVLRDTRQDPSHPPGFQIAYGALVDVKVKNNNNNNNAENQDCIGPYDKEAMTLFDYRTDHFDNDETSLNKATHAPTFMYAMPLQDNQVFFEETSLVARPAISFRECKRRFLRRMEYLGIEILKIHEEEFCYIPMGGSLPAKDQRIIGFGGAAAMVHPSTGYHLCRCLMGASDVARVIKRELQSSPDTPPNLDRVAAAAYNAIWSPSNVRQRNFAVFGGEFLMKQDVVGLRGFFDGFFRLPEPLWAGFLAGWPGLPNNDRHETWWARIWYGLQFIARLPPPVALDMLGSIVGYSIFEGTSLMQSVTPFFGEPDSYLTKNRNVANVGDVAAKNEAREMIQESTVTEEMPVDFDNPTPAQMAIGDLFADAVPIDAMANKEATAKALAMPKNEDAPEEMSKRPTVEV
jgi:lycopene beta-cyclase